MSQNILQYESDIWRTADLLIGAGIKQSDFPKYMMPYFALLMVESRLVRESKRLEEEVGKENIDDFIEEFKLDGLGYNDYIIRQNKTLKSICKNDKSFKDDFELYLDAFDNETKYLLGVKKGATEEKFLDISSISGLLTKKDILFETVSAWSEVDLTPFNNSEITTLEEHIKRKWADISADTAGEQYTPDDIISLITEIIASKTTNNDEFLTIYDPTCGGGNLLYGVEDKIKEKFPDKPTATYGEDWNDTLFALAKIESRFRNNTDIRHGNTLTSLHFIEKRFKIIVANPPYGVDWKGYQKAIKSDSTERFIALPSISDGQFLFTQHIMYQLAKDGLAVVVHNGSTLFSGDAGSGESNIRKYFFDNDWVEAVIQMPTDEFFNTGIYTYLWIFNKNKPKKRKNKVMLINASNKFVPLKKSKGKKRKVMDLLNRTDIVNALADYRDNDYCKIFDKWHFYFNKQSIVLTNIDEDGKFIQMPMKNNGEAIYIKLKLTQIAFDNDGKKVVYNGAKLTKFNKKNYSSLKVYFENFVKEQINSINYKESQLIVSEGSEQYSYDSDLNTLIKSTKNGKKTQLGCGKIIISASYQKATKTEAEHILFFAKLTKDLQKDYEIIPYNPKEKDNNQNIANFMAKYIFKPFEYKNNIVGVELNFNKVFYKPEILREISDIKADLSELELKLAELETDLAL